MQSYTMDMFKDTEASVCMQISARTGGVVHQSKFMGLVWGTGASTDMDEGVRRHR